MVTGQGSRSQVKSHRSGVKGHGSRVSGRDHGSRVSGQGSEVTGQGHWSESRAEVTGQGSLVKPFSSGVTGQSQGSLDLILDLWPVPNYHTGQGSRSGVKSHWSEIKGQWSRVTDQGSLVRVNGHWSVIESQGSGVKSHRSGVKSQWSMVSGQGSWSGVTVRGQGSLDRGHWSESVVTDQWSRVMTKGPRIWRPWLMCAVNQVAHDIRQFWTEPASR